jgi:hypothetical protein
LASHLLTDFLDAKITNDEYSDAFPSSTVDARLDADYRRFLVFCRDLDSHSLDRRQFSEDDIALFRRCIVAYSDRTKNGLSEPEGFSILSVSTSAAYIQQPEGCCSLRLQTTGQACAY